MNIKDFGMNLTHIVVECGENGNHGNVAGFEEDWIVENGECVSVKLEGILKKALVVGSDTLSMKNKSEIKEENRCCAFGVATRCSSV